MFPFGHDYRTPHAVLKLSNISRPRVTIQGAQRSCDESLAPLIPFPYRSRRETAQAHQSLPPF
jgi:hypothetical protein